MLKPAILYKEEITMGIYSDSKRFCDPDTGEELEVNMGELM